MDISNHCLIYFIHIGFKLIFEVLSYLWNSKPLDAGVLNLLRKKSKTVSFGSSKRKEYYALVAKSGFDNKLKEIAKLENILLIEQDQVLKT